MDPNRPSIDELIRLGAPRAPGGVADAVAARLARRRSRRIFTAASALLAAAALVILWRVRRPPVRESAWVVRSSRGASIDGRALVTGRPLAVGALVHVGAEGEARLERPGAGGSAFVELLADTDARVGDRALELVDGRARLQGPEARLTGPLADVTTLGAGAGAIVELKRLPGRGAPNAPGQLLAVAVDDGAARVLARGRAPILLAKNDRTLVAPRLPPLAIRMARRPLPPAHGSTPEDHEREVLRATVERHVNEIRFCYEQALVGAPSLSGQFIVHMELLTEEGVGRVSEAEIVPSDDGYLDSLSMQMCVLRAVSRWHFPPSADGQPVTVDYPFVFEARSTAAPRMKD